MAPVRPRALNCTQCGSPISVRNGFKAKTVACPACAALLDLTSPKYEVLSQLEVGKYPPRGHICVGMKGSIEDGAIEVVGRLRLKGSAYDDEDGWEYWFWDEWLVLTEKGAYFWIEEDEGKYTFNDIFMPEKPPPRSQFDDAKLGLNGEIYRIKERGEGTVHHVEGELTWKARLGDTISYLQAYGGGEAIAIEWNEDEIEFFKCKRLPQKALFELFGLKKHLAILEKKKVFDAARFRFTSRFVTAVGLLVFAGLLGLCAGVFQEAWNTTVAKGRMTAVAPRANVTAGPPSGESVPLENQLADAMEWTFDLNAGTDGYKLSANVLLVPPIDQLNFTLVAPEGETFSALEFKIFEPGWGREDGSYDFMVTSSGTWTLKVTGRAQGSPRTAAPLGSRLVAPPGTQSSLSWRLKESNVSPSFNCLGGILLLLFAVLCFVVGLIYDMSRRLGGNGVHVELRKETLAHHQSVREGEAT